jgi:hypothetical protein
MSLFNMVINCETGEIANVQLTPSEIKEYNDAVAANEASSI